MTTTPNMWGNVLGLAAEWFDPPDDGDGSDRELAIKCSQDLRVLIREAWPLLEPARPFVANWHIDCVAEHLMAVSAGEIKRLIVNQPPGTTKSSLVAVLWPAWEWMTRPHVRWIFASYAEKFAFRDSRKMRTLIQSRGGRNEGGLFERRGYQGVLALLGQAWTLAVDQNTKGRYDTSAGGFRLATSLSGQVTGDHGDRVVVDDPLNPKMARSTADRETANRLWDETFTSRVTDAKAAKVIVQQRLHENDLTGHLLAKKSDWHHLCLPAEYEPRHPFTYPAATRFVLPTGDPVTGDPRTEAGELLDPVRLPDEALAQHREMGTYAYSGQYQQLPSPEGGGMFKRGWYRRRWPVGFDMRGLSLRGGWDRRIQSWDMAFKSTDTSDFVVGQLWGFHGADAYLLAQVRGRFDFTTTCHVVKALTDFEPAAVAKLVEDKANGPAVISRLQRTVGGLIPINPKGGKPARASAVAPLHESGNVILPAADTIPCPESYVDADGQSHELTPTTVADWIHEHAIFNAGANDDQVDAMSQALTWANPQESQREPEMPGERPTESIMSGVMDMRF